MVKKPAKYNSGETVVDSYTGEGARQRAKKRAEELNNGQK